MVSFSRFTPFLCLLLSTPYHTDAGGKVSPHTSPQIQWVRHDAAMTAPGYDEAELIVADRLGNIYVAGSSERISNPSLGILIKYDRMGKELWRNEIPLGQLAMSIDSRSNLYLLEGGWYSSPRELSKYDAGGKRVWSIGNGSIDGFVVDRKENCYISTKVTNSLGWYGPYATEIVITKYSPEATIVWADTVLRDTSRQSPSLANVQLCVDSSENVVVASGGQILKLDSVGQALWAVDDTLTRVHEMVVDGGNHIYALATNRTSGDVPLDSNYFLIKLLPNGNREWMFTFPNVLLKERPGFRLQCDDRGNIFVVADRDSVLVIDKFRPTGQHVWNSRVKALIFHEWDCSTAPGGRLHIGVDLWNACTITCLDSSGLLAWTKNINEGKDNSHRSRLSGGMTTDADGNVTLACVQRVNPNSNWHTLHMDKNGQTLWEAIYDYKGNTQDYLYDLALDTEGNAIVTGRSESFDTTYMSDPLHSHGGHHWDFATVKYSPDGRVNWIARNRGDAHEGKYYRNLFLTVHPAGHAVISGADLIANSDEYRGVTIHYDADGSKSWESRYQVQHEFSVEGMVGDKEGNTYITGTAYYWKVMKIDPDVTWTTIKYSPTGEILWWVHVRDTSITRNIRYQAEDIALDSAGHVVAVATEWNRTGGSRGIALYRYTVDGRPIWNTRLDDPDCEFQDLEISRYSSIYLSSLVRHPSLQSEVMMFDSAGVLQWRSIFGVPGAISRPMTIDSEGGVYITGAGTANYDRDGKLRWYLGHQQGYAIACDSENAVYIADHRSVLKYSSSGAKVWEIEIPNTAEARDFFGRKIAVDKDRNVIVSGTSTLSSADVSGIVYTTVKLIQNLTAAGQEESDLPMEFGLGQNYPNPFNPATTDKVRRSGELEVQSSGRGGR